LTSSAGPQGGRQTAVTKVYPADVALSFPEREPTGRPRKHPVPSAASVEAAELIEARPEAFRTISWRTGTKGQLEAAFAAVRVRVADGPVAARGRHLPGEEAWLVGERRATGERKYYLSNLPPDTPLEVLAGLIKARRVCEQAHQQLKGELGLGHFEGRSGAPLPTARAPSPRALVPARVRLPAAPPARGGKAAPARARPDHRPDRACRRCAAASSPR
jgi:hypothetical protein